MDRKAKRLSQTIRGVAPTFSAESSTVKGRVSMRDKALIGEHGRIDSNLFKFALEDVRGLISILEMLKDKTEGRRTPEEDRILEGILYELRLGYLARAGVGGA